MDVGGPGRDCPMRARALVVAPALRLPAFIVSRVTQCDAKREQFIFKPGSIE